MKDLKIKTQLLGFAFFMLAIQIFLSGVGYYSLSSLSFDIQRVFLTRLPSIDFLVQADRDFQQALVAERTLLLQENLKPEDRVTLVKDYKKNIDQVSERFSKYKALANSDKEKELISKFEVALENWKNKSNTLLGITDSGSFGSSSDINLLIDRSIHILQPDFEAAREQLDLLQEEVDRLGTAEFDNTNTNYRAAEVLILFSAALSIFFAIGASLFLSHNVASRIKGVSHTLANSNIMLSKISSNLAKRSNSLAKASDEQSAAIAETSSSLHEISQTVENNTASANTSQEHVLQNEVQIKEGIQIIHVLNESIKEVENSFNGVVGSVEKNNGDLAKIMTTFQEIQSKTKVINDIVFQTKLLSFNASVEAARAGAHGKGFSVVAEEIGNLAQMSGASALEITSLLDESLHQVTSIIDTSKEDLDSNVQKNREKISSTVVNFEKCREVFESIRDSFESVKLATKEVVDASKEQEAGVNEINQAMHEINSANSISNKEARTIAKSSNDLLSVVHNITYSIEDLSKLITSVQSELSSHLPDPIVSAPAEIELTLDTPELIDTEAAKVPVEVSGMDAEWEDIDDYRSVS